MLAEQIFQAVQSSTNTGKQTTISTPVESTGEASPSNPDPRRISIPPSKQDSLPLMKHETSTQFFSERFAKAFPGVRGIQWFRNSIEAIERLAIFFTKPIVFSGACPI